MVELVAPCYASAVVEIVIVELVVAADEIGGHLLLRRYHLPHRKFLNCDDRLSLHQAVFFFFSSSSYDVYYYLLLPMKTKMRMTVRIVIPPAAFDSNDESYRIDLHPEWLAEIDIVVSLPLMA